MTAPPKPTFTTSISFGNIITIVSFIVAGGIAWGQLTSEIASERDMRSVSQDQLVQQVKTSGDEKDKIEARVRDLEQQQARIDERFTMLISLMTDLKTEVSQLTKRNESN